MVTRQTDLTRDKLLRAAFDEIHLHGFQAASIANILRDTGLTKGALYHHFPTKQTLGLAVIDEVVEAQLDAWIFSPLRESGQPVQTLLKLIDESGRKTELETIVLGCPLNNLMQEMSPLDEEFKTRLNRILSVWQAEVEGALKRDKKAGVVRSDVDCRAAALFIVSAWEGCVGIAKSQQSLKNFGLCMKQLHHYVQSLAVSGEE
ncbi:MAG TPA: TetR family transcriptional regulator C-terminal domain-containing protein [Gallionella sp.]|nr:TetR family transcriptional regulator C-terminal domain-containing protein [Gallionella sp.]